MGLVFARYIIAKTRWATLPLVAALFITMLGGCCNYVPYAVDNLSHHPIPRTLPTISPDPLETTTEGEIFQSEDGSKRYLIPRHLELALTPQGRIQAASLEGSGDPGLIFIANVTATSTMGDPFYPIQRLDMRPITHTPNSNKLRVTVVPGASERAPFSAIVIIQVYGEETIEGFKGILRTGAGILLEAHFDVMYVGQGVREVTIPVFLDQAGITEQTM